MTPQPSESFQPPPGSTTSTAVSEVADADKQRPLSPAHRALLRAALGNGQAALDAYAEWQRWVDLDALDDEAYRQLPRLYRNLVRLGVQDAQMPRLRGIYRRTWYGNRLALLWMGEVLSTLANAGVEAPVLTAATTARSPPGCSRSPSMSEPGEPSGSARDVTKTSGTRSPRAARASAAMPNALTESPSRGRSSARASRNDASSSRTTAVPTKAAGR